MDADKLKALAEKVKEQLSLSYDEESVKFLEGLIERVKPEFKGSEANGLVNSIGAFLGECIIINYGGQWSIDEETQRACIIFDQQNKIFPFSKTAKQFANGLEDSIYSFYTVIPTVFKLKKS